MAWACMVLMHRERSVVDADKSEGEEGPDEGKDRFGRSLKRDASWTRPAHVDAARSASSRSALPSWPSLDSGYFSIVQALPEILLSIVESGHQQGRRLGV